MPKLSTREQFEKLIDVVVALELKKNEEGVALPQASVGPYYLALGYHFPLDDLPVDLNQHYKMFDKKKIRDDYKKEFKREFLGKLSEKIDSTFPPTSAAENWKNALLRGLVAQQNLLDHKKSDFSSWLNAIEFFVLSAMAQHQDEHARQLPSLALYHLALLLQNEKVCQSLAESTHEKKKNWLLEQLVSPNFPLDADGKRFVGERCQKDVGDAKSLIRNIGFELEKASYAQGHLLAAMSMAIKEGRYLRYHNEKDEAAGISAIKRWGYVLEVANAHGEEFQAAAEQAEKELNKFSWSSAALQLYIIKHPQLEQTDVNRLLEEFKQKYSKNLSTHFAGLASMLEEITEQWKRFYGDGRQPHIDSWVQFLFDFARQQVNDFKDASVLAYLANLYHLASPEKQADIINQGGVLSFDQFVETVIHQSEKKSNWHHAGQGLIQFTDIIKSSAKFSEKLAKQQAVYSRASALAKAIVSIGDKSQCHHKRADHAHVQKLLKDYFFEQFFNLFNRLRKGNAQWDSVELNEKKMQASRALAAFFSEKLETELVRQLSQQGIDYLDNLPPEYTVRTVITSRDFIEEARQLIDELYDPGKTKRGLTDTSLGYFKQHFEQALVEAGSFIPLPKRLGYFVTEAKLAVVDYFKNPPESEPKKYQDVNQDITTLDRVIYQAAKRGKSNAVIDSDKRYAAWIEQLETRSGDEKAKVFQGLVQANLALFKTALAANTLSADEFSHQLQTLLTKYLSAEDLKKTSSSDTFIALADFIVTLNESYPKCATELATTLAGIDPQYVPVYTTLTEEAFETFVKFTELAYPLSKRETDAFRKEVGIFIADQLHQIETNEGDDFSALEIASFVDAEQLRAYKTCYQKRGAKKAEEISASQAFQQLTQDYVQQASTAAGASQQNLRDDLNKLKELYVNWKDSVDSDAKFVKIAYDAAVEAHRKQAVDGFDPWLNAMQTASDAERARRQAHQDYQTENDKITHMVSQKKADELYDELLSTPLKVHGIIQANLAAVTQRMADMARGYLPVPENDVVEQQIKTIMKRIAAGEDVDGFNSEGIRALLKEKEVCEHLEAELRRSFRQSTTSSDPYQEKQKLLENQRQLQSFAKQAELSVRKWVYQQYKIDENIAENMYPLLFPLQKDFHDTVRVMMNTVGAKTAHHISASFNLAASAGITPPLSLKEVWPALLFIYPRQLFGEQALHGGIVRDDITQLFESNLKPAVRSMMLSIVVKELAKQAESSDVDSMISVWLLSKAIEHEIQKQEDGGLGRGRLKTLSGGGYELGKDSEFKSLMGSAPYQALQNIASNLRGRLFAKIPLEVIRVNLDRLYQESLQTSYRACRDAASHFMKAANFRSNHPNYKMFSHLQELHTHQEPIKFATIFYKLSSYLLEVDASLPLKTFVHQKDLQNYLYRKDTHGLRTLISSLVAQKDGWRTLSSSHGPVVKAGVALLQVIANIFLQQTTPFGERTEFEADIPKALIDAVAALPTELRSSESSAEAVAAMLRAVVAQRNRSARPQSVVGVVVGKQEEKESDDDDFSDEWTSDEEDVEMSETFANWMQTALQRDYFTQQQYQSDLASTYSALSAKVWKFVQDALPDNYADFFIDQATADRLLNYFVEKFKALNNDYSSVTLTEKAFYVAIELAYWGYSQERELNIQDNVDTPYNQFRDFLGAMNINIREGNEAVCGEGMAAGYGHGHGISQFQRERDGQGQHQVQEGVLRLEEDDQSSVNDNTMV